MLLCQKARIQVFLSRGIIVVLCLQSSPDKIPDEVQVSPCNKENTIEHIKSSTKIKQMTGIVLIYLGWR